MYTCLQLSAAASATGTHTDRYSVHVDTNKKPFPRTPCCSQRASARRRAHLATYTVHMHELPCVYTVCACFEVCTTYSCTGITVFMYYTAVHVQYM